MKNKTTFNYFFLSKTDDIAKRVLKLKITDYLINSFACAFTKLGFTDRSKAVVLVLVLLFVALWFILRGDLFYVLPCVVLFLCFSVLLPLRVVYYYCDYLVWGRES